MMTRLLIVAGMGLLLGLTASAQPTKMKSVEDEIRKLDIAAAKAVMEKDERAIRRFFTTDAVTNNPRNNLTIGSEGIIEAARGNVINYHSFTREIESLKVRDRTAIVMGNETVVMKGADGLAGATIRRRYTNVWMKLGNTWQIVGRHASVICP